MQSVPTIYYYNIPYVFQLLTEAYQGGILFFNGRLIFHIQEVENEPPVKKEYPPLYSVFVYCMRV